MDGKLLFDLLGQDRDLLNEAGQGGHQRAGDMGVRAALLAVAPRGGDQTHVQNRWVGAAGVCADFSQAPSRMGVSQSARSWRSNRTKNFKLIAESNPNSRDRPG